MLGWVIRIFFIIAGFITSFFVTRDALNFDVVQTVIAVILFTLFIAIVAFWPTVKEWIHTISKK